MNRGKAERREEGAENTVIMGTSSTRGLIAFHQKKTKNKMERKCFISTKKGLKIWQKKQMTLSPMCQ